ncbi:MAG: S1 RNA-binding domain-containing protein, partial [Candidatus Hydrogenedentes bacterium]|nr:S1 RNA-binding domain-containing protein [Candidatus Hydrogenedentota bacterium]
LIGPGGKVIRGICASTGAEIDVDDDGNVSISATDAEALKAALKMVEDVCAEAEIGKIYDGTVQRIVDFGAFVEILPGKDGLVRIGELADYHVNRVEDIVKEGDAIKVKCIEIDNMGRINLSKIEAERDLGLAPPRKEGDRRPHRSSNKSRGGSNRHSRGGNDRSRGGSGRRR